MCGIGPATFSHDNEGRDIMAKAKTYDPPTLTSGIGGINSGDPAYRVPSWVLRVGIAVGVVLGYGFVPGLRSSTGTGLAWAANHLNRAGEHLPGGRRAAIIHVRAAPKVPLEDEAGRWIVLGIALALVLGGVVVLSQRRRAAGRRPLWRPAVIVVGVLAVVVGIGWGAMQWEPAQPAMVLVLRLCSSLLGAVAQFIAGAGR